MKVNDPPQTVKQLRDVYNEIASHFFVTREFKLKELEPLSRHVKKGEKVLDVGCGFGRVYQLLRDWQVSYVGLDQSEEQLKIAREKFPGAEFVIGEMTALPFAAESFDAVFCIAAFHHLPSKCLRLQALREMKRVVKKGGKIVMMNWNLYSEWGNWKLKKLEIRNLKLGVGGGDFLVPWKNSQGEVIGERYYHAFTPSELAELFGEAGLAVAEQYYVLQGRRSNVREGENVVSVVFKAE